MHEVTAFSIDLPCLHHKTYTQNSHLPTSPPYVPVYISVHIVTTEDPEQGLGRLHQVVAHTWESELVVVRMGNDCPKGPLGEEWSKISPNRSAYFTSLGPWRYDFAIQAQQSEQCTKKSVRISMMVPMLYCLSTGKR